MKTFIEVPTFIRVIDSESYERFIYQRVKTAVIRTDRILSLDYIETIDQEDFYELVYASAETRKYITNKAGKDYILGL